MIVIFVETQKIYSYEGDGMPKIEKIEQSFSEVEFIKFLKYLPFQNYLNNKLKVTKVEDWDRDVKKASFPTFEYEARLKQVVAKLSTTEPTVHDQLEAEKKRNDELMKRLEALEAKIPEQKVKLVVTEEVAVEEVKDENLEPSSGELETLRAEYTKKHGKKPFHKWDVEILKSKI